LVYGSHLTESPEINDKDLMFILKARPYMFSAHGRAAELMAHPSKAFALYLGA
jgi:hypothetical protein